MFKYLESVRVKFGTKLFFALFQRISLELWMFKWV